MRIVCACSLLRNADRTVPYHLGLKPQREGGVLKWKLMLSTMPVVLALLGIKLFLELVLGFQGLIDFSDVGIILTSGVFLIGFLLAGTMADYKEAEKLPADMACTLETLEEIFALAATDRPSLDTRELRREVLTLTDSIRDWLVRKCTTDQVYAAMTRMSEVLHAALLGRAGLRAAAALRHGGRRRHLPHRDLPARARPRAVEGGLRAALAAGPRTAATARTPTACSTTTSTRWC
jgi:hypothetical protein